LDTTFYIILKHHFTYNVFVIIKSRGKVHCIAGDEGPEGSRGIAAVGCW
jgi:hypothetical protein